jgi:hypothetical protein
VAGKIDRLARLSYEDAELPAKLNRITHRLCFAQAADLKNVRQPSFAVPAALT